MEQLGRKMACRSIGWVQNPALLAQVREGQLAPARQWATFGRDRDHLCLKECLYGEILFVERGKNASQKQVNASLSKVAVLRGGEDCLRDIEDDAGMALQNSVDNCR